MPLTQQGEHSSIQIDLRVAGVEYYEGRRKLGAMCHGFPGKTDLSRINKKESL